MGCLGAYLPSGKTMKAGDWLLSPNGQYSAVMQDDGNFVLYWGRYPDRLVGPMWATDTGNKPGASITLQTDGNFIINGGWMSGTGGRSGPAYAAMQDNGDFALWTGTPDNPGSFYFTTGTWQGTLAVQNNGAYEAHVSVAGNDSGKILKGPHNRGMVHFPVSRTATADFSVCLGKQHFGLIQLGACRSRLYLIGGSSTNPSGPTAAADHGPF